ncbi:MAG: tetratricopeptide repeat protein, partial [Sulfurimonas sp.]|nr:tetratricopeptide repeat protein [Sulfurimonas sp.]
VNIAREVGAKIIFVKPAINLKDMSPFKSEHKEGLSKKALEKWQELYDRASILHKVGNLDEALSVYKQALIIDNRYADLHYSIGQVLFELKKYDEAKKAFQIASDEDIAPLRILSSMLPIIENIASKNNVPLIDFPRIIKSAYLREYNYTIFGKEYFVDHVHTTIEGYRLLGLALMDELVRQGIAVVDNTWDEDHIEEIRQQIMVSLDISTHTKAMKNLAKVLGWAGKFDEADKAMQQSLAMRGLETTTNIQTTTSLAPYINNKALSQNLQKPGENFDRAVMLIKTGKIDEAVKHFKEELQINKNKRVIEKTRLNMAYIYYIENRFDEAETHLRAVLKNNQTHYEAHTYLGIVLKKQGRTEEAADHFAEALRLNPDYELAKKSLEIIMMEEASRK